MGGLEPITAAKRLWRKLFGASLRLGSEDLCSTPVGGDPWGTQTSMLFLSLPLSHVLRWFPVPGANPLFKANRPDLTFWFSDFLAADFSPGNPNGDHLVPGPN